MHKIKERQLHKQVHKRQEVKRSELKILKHRQSRMWKNVKKIRKGCKNQKIKKPKRQKNKKLK